MGRNCRRVAIVAGLRTAFAKQGGAYRGLSARELGGLVVAELLRRSELQPGQLQQLVFGQVIPAIGSHNPARDLVLAAGLPPSVEAYSVARACATSYQAVVGVAESIQAEAIDCAIAAGADSASSVPVVVSPRFRDALLQAKKARTLRERWAAFSGLRPRDLNPVPMELRELSTGLSMGESAEQMAQNSGITRQAQDEYAHRSHCLAARAWAEDKFAGQVMTVFVPPGYSAVAADTLVRKDSDLQAYARLRPVFDPVHGTVTAGNSSPLTDGAAALLLMSAARAESEGRRPLGYIRGYAFAGLDPERQLLLGPAYATPLALQRAGLSLRDLDLIDMHEAFAAQVLSTTQAFESRQFAARQLGRSEPIGTVDWDRFNTTGGSIALGHPFAATGARQILQTLHELRRRGGQFALCTSCAAGGLGASLVLEAA